MERLRISAGEDTEAMLQFVLEDLSDEQLDELDIHRTPAPDYGMNNEPITISVVIGAATVAAVTRLIGQWIETRRQIKQLEIVAQVPEDHPETRNALVKLAGDNAAVALRYAEPSADLELPL